MPQDLSRHQSKIVKRYYDNQETIQSDRLGELVSELWLAEDEKALAKLWGKAQVALMRLGVDATRVAAVVNQRDMEALAKLVTQVQPGGKAAPGTAPRPAGSGGGSAGASGGSSAGAPGGSSGGDSGGHRGATPLDDLELKARGARSLADGRTVGQMRAEAAAAGGYDSLEEPNLKRALKAFRRKLKSFRRDDESRLGSKYGTSGKVSAITAIEPPKEFPAAVWQKLADLGRLKRSGGGTYEIP